MATGTVEYPRGGGWQSITNASVFTGEVWYRKRDNFVEVVIYAIQVKTAARTITLGTLPTEFRPYIARITTGADSTDDPCIVFAVLANGNVVIGKKQGTVLETSKKYSSCLVYMLR